MLLLAKDCFPPPGCICLNAYDVGAGRGKLGKVGLEKWPSSPKREKAEMREGGRGPRSLLPLYAYSQRFGRQKRVDKSAGEREK